MTRVGIRSLVWLLVPVLTAPLRAEAPAGAEANAALKYWQAFALFPTLDEKKSEQLKTVAAGRGPLESEWVTLLESAESAFRELARGAHRKQCTWDLSLEDGFNAMLPHLSKARAAARFATARARLRFERNQADAAVDDLCDAMTLARHVGADELPISMLVDFSIEQGAIEMLAGYLPKAPAAAVDSFVQRVEGLPRCPTLRRAMAMERQFGLGWIIEDLGRTGGKERLLQLLRQSQLKNIASFEQTNQDELLKSARSLLPMYDEVISAADRPPAELEQLQATIRQKYSTTPQTHELVELFLPAIGKMRQAEAAFQTRLVLLRAAVAVVRQGPEVLKQRDLADPVLGGHFQHVPFDGGFELRADAKTADGKPVILVVGQRKSANS